MSKRILQHPKETETGPKYWRSLGQLADTPEFREWAQREFPQGASELNTETSRRSFMKYMAASAALAGLSLSACRREVKNLVPFSRGVEWNVPGKPIFYATSRPHRRGAQPLVVATYDGRPTKVEGNPFHPASNGATDIHSQSSLLDMYDPDRSRHFRHGGNVAEEKDFTTALEALLKEANDGSGIAFLTEHFTSPTYRRLRDEVAKKLPKAMWADYEPLGGEEARAANEAAFGKGLRAIPNLEKADAILALDCDFLGFDEGTLEGIRAFSKRRSPEQAMNRLYVVENRYTTTGGMADHRLRVQAGKVGTVARQFAEIIAEKTGDAGLKSVVAKFPQSLLESAEGTRLGEEIKKIGADTDRILAKTGLESSVNPNLPSFFTAEQRKWIAVAAEDLIAKKGAALVLVGYRQPAAVQALVHAINAALGALGTTLVGRKTSVKAPAGIAELAKEITGGNVKTLFILGGNPAFNAPADLKFARLLRDVKTVIRHGLYEDETSVSAEDGKQHWVKWQVPAAHYLEAWGDGRASDNSILSQQPMILPLYGGWSEIQLLDFILTGKKSDGLDLVQATFKQEARGIDTESWAKFLHDGFLAGSQSKPEPLALNGAAVAELASTHKHTDGVEVVFASCTKVDDGRYANNGWLQELPDPITKITWDNAAQISPATATKLGLHAVQGNGRFIFDNGSWITIEVNGNSLEIPVAIIPGHADDSITIALGYGRTFDGRVGGRDANYMSHGGLFAYHTGVGFNAYKLRTSAAHYIAGGAKIRRIERKAYKLAVTQEHGAMEGRGADLIREATAATHQDEPGFAKDEHWLHQHGAMDAEAERRDAKGYPIPQSTYSHPELKDKNHQWGMAIDLSTCTGCAACVVACQSENNIPIVGKEQVAEGREMSWIRMDRYFVSDMNNRGHTEEEKRINISEPRMVMQPMPCQHCENAPCETVCPVNATVHSDDGLNVMAYNRCIGTRYCANNCPFKVRRFNFFDFNERKIGKFFRWNLVNEKGMDDTLKLSKNPNVTVRMRGVMEKCTFCVQRIQEAKIAAKVKAKDTDKVQVPTDSFQSACQQACPSNAIVFGNLKDPNSAVTKMKDNPRDYRLLDYIGVNARVSYLARVMNPNKNMPDAPKDALMHYAHGGKA
ncbi:MAG: TAT-variant-translocated molybdopterin oxidoreductase [Chthoniobacteraceae bacterium]